MKNKPIKKSIILIRTEDNLKKKFQKAAKADGCNTLSAWVIFTLKNAANKILSSIKDEDDSEEKLLK